MAKRIANASMLVALALIFSYVEILIPFSFGIPGIKLGLANIVVVTGLYILNPKEVLGILVARIVLVSFLFAGMSTMIYSLVGGILSFGIMLLLKKCKGFSTIGISIAGGIVHNTGQLIVAALVVESLNIFYYMPVLMVSGLITGMLIGIVAEKVSSVLEKIKD